MKKILALSAVLLSILYGQVTGARYLIITHDDYYNDVLPLAGWKHKKGMRIKIAKLSEIGSTASQIRSYVLNAYNTWQVKPEFLLLVGAPNYLPFPTIGSVHTDNYYTNMDADIYNEILSGRFTVHNSTEMHTVVNKILMYEHTPYLADSLWFKKACLIANDYYDNDSIIYRLDAEYAASYMVDNGYAVIDTLFYRHGDNAQTVINNTNNGRMFVLYRGTGTNNWHYPFEVYPDNLSNGNKLPIVVSATCNTLGSGPTPATAERWFLTGSPTALRGGSGYFATSTSGSNIAHLRSAVTRGFFDGVFLYNYGTFGEACEEGRKNVYHMYGSTSEYYGFTTVGDPEMRIWTATPCSIAVAHPQFVPLGSADILVNVKRKSDMMPVDNAFVCLMADHDTLVYVLDTTDAGGNANIPVNASYVDDTVFVTVTGKNLTPYEGYMIVKPFNTPYIIYKRSMIDDSTAGNNNNIINPGETINVSLWVENLSDSTGYGVCGILSTVDPYISITDSIKAFGDIAGHDSAYTGDDGFEFDVSGACPDEHNVIFDLVCRDANDSAWVSHFNKPVKAVQLVFQQAQVSGGNGNISFEVGETVFVAVMLKNEGSSPIDNVSAILRSLTPDIIIIDSAGDYGRIGSDSSATNSANPFIAHADASIPQGTIANFEMILSAPFYLDTVSFSLVVGKIDYYIWNPDPTPTPGRHMHLLLSSHHYSGEIGTALPGELHYYNCVFVCAGVFPNNFVIPANCVEATRLVNYANNGGRLYMEGGDVWFYDPLNNGGHDFEALFGMNATADGGSNMGPVEGIAGTFTSTMAFSYGGENTWMDHISPLSPGSFLIFRDSDDNYDCGVAYDPGTHRTVGTSFELGLLDDAGGGSTRFALLDSIMHFFGLGYGIEEDAGLTQANKPMLLEVYPNPFSTMITISVGIEQSAKSTGTKTSCTMPHAPCLKIYDASGRLVKSFSLPTNYHLPTTAVTWHGTDDSGCRLPAGIYFVQLEAGKFKKTEKVVLLR